MDWKQEVLKRLDGFTAAIGKTGTALWDIMVRQGYVVGISGLLESIMLWIVAYMLYKICMRFHAAWLVANVNNKSYYTSGDGYLAGAVVSGIAAAVVVLVAFVMFDSGIQHLLNPQYFPIEQVLEHIKPN